MIIQALFLYLYNPNQENMKGISKKLQDLIPQYKEGKTFEFKLDGLESTRTDKGRTHLMIPALKNVPSENVIYDPWGGEDGGGENITISFIKMERVNKAGSKNDQPSVELGRTQFHKSEKGRKTFSGNRKADLNEFEYLFLCGYNSANIGKPWHLEPNRGSYIYHYVDREVVNKATLDSKKMRHQAESIAFDLSDADLRILCKKLSEDKGVNPPFVYKEHWTEEEVRSILHKFAGTNPGKVITKHKEYNFAIEGLIKEAIAQKIIKHDKAKKEAVYVSSGALIVVVPQNKKLNDVLANYFMTPEGKDDLATIVAQLQALEEGKE